MINTYSSFFYIDGVTASNFYLNFDEGAGELTAQVESGNYTHSDLAGAVSSALNDVGGLTYTVAFDRDLRLYTISASGNFTLKITSGANVGTDIFPLLGFTGADLSGLSTYTANLQAGSEYVPQFWLQDYVDIEDLQKAVSASINKSASGKVEVVKFGIEKFFEMNLKFITDVDQGQGNPILTNLNGVQDARLFLRFVTQKQELEFMPDKSNKANFFTVLLESTAESKDGTGYRLKELYTSNLPGYYETGKLVFRLVE
jgi:hypothetical protein